MIDKRKVLKHLEESIESCQATNTFGDQQIEWYCKQLIERINAGMFDKK